MRTALALFAFLGVMVLVGSIEASGNSHPRPCYKHPTKASAERSGPVVTKAMCLRQYKRNRMDWPPRPKEWEIKRRIGMAQWRKAERIAYCETAGNWQHYPHGRFIGGMGMFRQTYGYGQRVTGYRWVSEGATKAEQIAIAVASHPITRGWSGWGCGGA